MNEEQAQAVRSLRDAGFAVCIFTPDELRGAKPGHVEDRLVERGWDVIDCICEEQEAAE